LELWIPEFQGATYPRRGAAAVAGAGAGLSGGGDGGERGAEEMLVLGELTVRTARFLEAVSGAYTFFAFAISVSGAVMLAASLAGALGLGAGPALASLASLAGVGLGYALSALVPGRARRYAESVLSGGGRRRVGQAVFWAAFLAGFAAGSMLAAVAPGCAGAPSVSWYPGLVAALAFVGLAFRVRGERRGGDSFLVAALVGATLYPLVLYTCDTMAGLGAMMFSYLAGGSWALWEASRVFS